MATTYKSKAMRTCWKQHTCVTCGSAYKYSFTRYAEGTASTPAGAQANASKLLQTALDTTFDLKPCPFCGLMQPEMVGQARGERHGCMIGTSFLLLVVLSVMYGFGWAHFRTLSYVALAATIFITLKHIAAALHNPNFDMTANKAKAAKDVEAGATALVEKGADPGLDSLPTSVTPVMKTAILMLLATWAMFPAAEVYRMASGWTYNAQCEPPVAGPGEVVRIDTGHSVSSIKGYWNGAGTVLARNTDELGVESDAFPVIPHHDYSSGGRLSWKSSERSDSSNVYAEIKIPDAPQLAGKTAVLEIAMDLKTPQFKSSSAYTEQGQSFTLSKRLAIAARGAGQRYMLVWWAGMIGGLVLQLLAGFILSMHSDRLKKGLPTQLLPIS